MDLALPKGLIVRARRQTAIMRAEIYTDFLRRRVSLRFELSRIWASEEAEMVTLY